MVLQAIDWAQCQASDEPTYAVAPCTTMPSRATDPGQGRGLDWLVGRDGNDVPHAEAALQGAQHRMLTRRGDPVRVPTADRAPANLGVGDPPVH